MARSKVRATVAASDPTVEEVAKEPIPDVIEFSEAEAPTEPSSGVPPAETLPETIAAQSGRRRRVRIALLLFLTAIASALLIFSGWYLLFRKPISEFPLPGPSSERMPGFGYSLYGVSHPMGIAVSPDGSRIYATQGESGAAVIAFDSHGTVLATMSPPDTADHVFVYVAVEPQTGNVYVTDRAAGAIQVYSPDGAFLRTFREPETLAGWQPLGLSFGADGHMFVTDVSLQQVHEFAADGSLVRTIGTDGQFNFPNAAVAGAAGTLYVADSNNGRVLLLDVSGALLSVIGRGPSDGDVGVPRGMAIDDQGRLYVVDSVDQSVKVYRLAQDGSLTFIGRFGQPGIDDGAFQFPNAVATDARGRVYVADSNNNRVQVWSY